VPDDVIERETLLPVKRMTLGDLMLGLSEPVPPAAAESAETKEKI
jgi:hypothetical protein